MNEEKVRAAVEAADVGKLRMFAEIVACEALGDQVVVDEYDGMYLRGFIGGAVGLLGLEVAR